MTAYSMATVEAYHKDLARVFPQTPELPVFVESLKENGFEIEDDENVKE